MTEVLAMEVHCPSMRSRERGWAPEEHLDEVDRGQLNAWDRLCSSF